MNKTIQDQVQLQMMTKPIALVAMFFLLAFATTGQAQGQDQTKSSTKEDEAVKKVESNGGRVFRISAADTAREVSFYLSSTPVGDEQLAGINEIGEVIWVNLAGTNVTDDGLKHLAGLPIQKLHLERTRIGDDGLSHLKSFKELTYLNVYDTKVTDAGLEHLKDLKQLKKLFVWKSGVTEAGIKKLNESLPELKIVGELKLEPVVIEEPKQEEAAKPKKKNKLKEQTVDPNKSPDKAKDGTKGDTKAIGEVKAKEKKSDDK